jgi:hypothetical protein
VDKNKVGQFIFPINIFHEKPGLMLAVFQDMKVLNARFVELETGRPAIKYRAIHSEFRELEEGDSIPYYKITVGISGVDFEEIPSPPLSGVK